uniref:Uncharacterized protein n=1 Tax=Arundo donax TaxID=35708 RepID=A0A0A9D8E2_ARUDO
MHQQLFHEHPVERVTLCSQNEDIMDCMLRFGITVGQIGYKKTRPVGKRSPPWLCTKKKLFLTRLRKSPQSRLPGRATWCPGHMGHVYISEDNRSGYVYNMKQPTRGLFFT